MLFIYVVYLCFLDMLFTYIYVVYICCSHLYMLLYIIYISDRQCKIKDIHVRSSSFEHWDWFKDLIIICRDNVRISTQYMAPLTDVGNTDSKAALVISNYLFRNSKLLSPPTLDIEVALRVLHLIMKDENGERALLHKSSNRVLCILEGDTDGYALFERAQIIFDMLYLLRDYDNLYIFQCVVFQVMKSGYMYERILEIWNKYETEYERFKYYFARPFALDNPKKRYSVICKIC